MADGGDVQEGRDQAAEQEARRRAAEAEVLRLYLSLSGGVAPSGGDLARYVNDYLTGNFHPLEMRAKIVKEKPRETAATWLQDPKKREQLRSILRDDARTLSATQADPNSLYAGRTDFPGVWSGSRRSRSRS